ncbi:GerAB/ArcD/ProY family transporter [Caproicibacter sp.]|uniref:GerAB/ArcD/ProY family transporter n=1 Tax=Caproicibacter sp. TaxID=2814884 RepID=UPI003989ED41
MNKTEITGKQMSGTVAMFLIGSALVSSGSTSAKQDSWICILTAAILVIPILWVHSAILNLYPGRNYFYNVLRAMGRPAGTVVVALLTVYTLHLGALVLRIFSEFIHIINMKGTPIIAISSCIMAVIVYVMSNRLFVLSRIAKFVLPLLYLSVAMTILLSSKDMDLNNMLPIFETKPKDFWNGVLSSLALPYGEILVCAPMFGALDRKEKIFPTMLKGTLLALIVLFAAFLRNLLVLGYSATVYAFPSYGAVSVIQLGEFFTRIEVIIGINLLLAGFIKTGVLVFSSCAGMAQLFGLKDYEPLVAPVALLILTLAVLVHSNTVELFRFVKYLPAYSLPFQVVLPILVLIVGKARKQIQKKRTADPTFPHPGKADGQFRRKALSLNEPNPLKSGENNAEN